MTARIVAFDMPYKPLGTCDVCGQPKARRCICPACPVCGEVGNPGCYEGHGLIRSFAQTALYAQAEAEWRENYRAAGQHHKRELMRKERSIEEEMWLKAEWPKRMKRVEDRLMQYTRALQRAQEELTLVMRDAAPDQVVRSFKVKMALIYLRDVIKGLERHGFEQRPVAHDALVDHDNHLITLMTEE